MRRSASSLLHCGLALLAPSAGATAQAAASASLSTDTVDMGEVFELRVRLSVPPRTAVFFPDSVASASVLESFAPVAWQAEAAPEGGASLTLTYPLIGFGAGTVPVPGIDVFLRPAGDQGGGALPGGSVVGDWRDAPRGSQASLFVTRIPRQAVWMNPVFTADDFVRGVDPMPPDDVVGASWHWPAVALVLLFSSVLGGAVLSTTRTLLADRALRANGAGSTAPMTRDEARLWALRELDRLLAGAPGERAELRPLYTESSGIVRVYAQYLDAGWGPALTSNELMRQIDASPSTEAGTDLIREMQTAEAVKFGRLRPEVPAVRAHLGTLRTWVDSSGESAEA